MAGRELSSGGGGGRAHGLGSLEKFSSLDLKHIIEALIFEGKLLGKLEYFPQIA